MSADSFDSWCILELMGHVRTAGRVTEEERFGVKMGRVDVPDGGGFVTVYFGGASVYRLTPTTEEVARAVAARARPEPVHRWELPAPAVPTRPEEDEYQELMEVRAESRQDDYDDDDDDDDDEEEI